MLDEMSVAPVSNKPFRRGRLIDTRGCVVDYQSL